MIIKKIFFCLAISFSLSGCTYLYDKFVYQIDVTQGNYIDSAKLAQIEIGMTQEQIIFVLGSPMLIDQFDSSKWYYVRYIKPGGEKVQQSQIILTFKDKKLTEINSENTGEDNPLVEQSAEKKEPNEAAENAQPNKSVTSE
ncbi:outer membrane protein assembly factor BamE [Psychromonas sp. RZ22]|uniref:outer membrane protein assembly factor BamE n=1 Tax=Psychromonas algarum TaxID=2555643 RepID=UPI001067C188|nr:outer membrane protein assembly factor BamE [Psychromonas sp. RZ22]TEW55990.1 outer membrane protein assembly factor BamE [Psychromonas sp. RZ22]